MNRDVIIACDFSSEEVLFKFLEKFDHLEEKPYLKIGMEMYYSTGNYLVKTLKERGYKIFLDLKLHDIPNTVKKAIKNLTKLNVDIINIHAAGTIKMMQGAMEGVSEAVAEGAKKPLVIAVTQLTSTDQNMLNNELLVQGEMKDVVRKYAANAKEAGLDGIVCSVYEAPVANELGLVSVTPGIRFATDSKDDQKRVATPAFAKELGSTFIVVGRSITGSENPVEAYERCLKEFL